MRTGKAHRILPILLFPALAVAAGEDGVIDVSGFEGGAPSAFEADGGGAPDPRSLDELFIDMVNPFGAVFFVEANFEHTQFQGDLGGADDQTRQNLDITASWPFLLDSGRRVVARMTFPISMGEPTYFTPTRDYTEWAIRQDADTLPDGQPWFDGHGALGDIEWDIAWGGVSEGGWITGVGIAGVLPTGQDGSIERDQYLLGPDFTLGKITDWGILGTRLRHLTDVADVSNAKEFITWETNETHLELFYAYQLGNGWSLVSNPTLVVDWEATSGNKVLLPLGGGASKMMRWFGMPVKLDLEFEYYAVTPDIFGPEWIARIRLAPAIIDRFRR